MMVSGVITLRGSCALIPRRVGRWLCCSAIAGLLVFVTSGCGESGIARESESAHREPTHAPAAGTHAATPVAAPAKKLATRSVGVRSDVRRHAGETLSSPTVPAWAADAIFYQIFPERFCNADRSNDPTRESLEAPDLVSKSWTISPWTGDWYARADWEKERGPNFFENGVFDRRYGGDLQGVIVKLDYLSSLGINVIYLNPVFYARSLHKYDGSSFHHVDPYFGPDPPGDLKLMETETSDPASWKWTAADKLFLELVKKAHARNIRVIIDGVFNHTGRDFFAFADLRKRQGASAYRDWYIVQSYDDPATPQNEFRYKGWWGTDSLPEFANDNAGNDLHAGPKKYILDSTKRWMDPNGDGDPSDGIDGWRLDVANEVPTGFWRAWHAVARQINPQCYTLAEIWDDAQRLLDEGQFSATMNYFGFSFPVKGFLIDETLAPSGAARLFDERRQGFPLATQYALQNLMDSHDTDRLASMIVNAGRRPYKEPNRFDYDLGDSPRYVPDYDVRQPNDRERRVQRLVSLLQMTYVGPPMIYYGTEAGMWGADDPCDRMPMVWPEISYDPQRADPLSRTRQPDPVAFDDDLFRFYQAAIKFRRDNPALRRGDIEFVATDDQAEFLAFRRSDATDSLLIGLNRGGKPFKWNVPVANGEAVSQVFTASGEVAKFTSELKDGATLVAVPAVDGVVLRVSSKK
jgi:cyclomaltodextrinase